MKQEIIEYLNRMGFSTNSELIVTYKGVDYSMEHMIEPFISGDLKHLNFDSEHICNEVIIKTILQVNEN